MHNSWKTQEKQHRELVTVLIPLLFTFPSPVSRVQLRNLNKLRLRGETGAEADIK